MGLKLIAEIAVPRDVFPGVVHRDPLTVRPEDGIVTFPHLGRTVSVVRKLSLESGTREGIRRIIDDFWATLEAMRSRTGATPMPADPIDWTRVDFPLETMIDRVDTVSLDRVTASWGWASRKIPFRVSLGFPFSIDVAGTTIDLREVSTANGAYDSSLGLSSPIYFPLGKDADAWARTQGKRRPWAGFAIGDPHRTTAATRIDLRKGIALAELRRRVRDFAAHVASLKKEVGALEF